MIEQTKARAIAAIVSLAAPSFLALQPDAARAQSVCGRNTRLDYFETQNHDVSICNERGQLTLIAVDRRDDRSFWARAMQSSPQSYRARNGDTEYVIDRDRLAIYQNGWQIASELVLLPLPLPSGGRLSERYDLRYDYEAGYRNGYDEGWRIGAEDRNFSYDPGRAMGNAANGSDEYSLGYRAGFRNGYNDGYDGRRYDLRR